MTIPPNTIGYFAIIMPEEGEFSGAFLTDDPSTNSAVNLLMAGAMASGVNPYGTLAATIVEGATSGRADIVATAARAYSALTKSRYFYVVGRKDSGGTHTEIREFEARTVGDARAELEQVPEVIEIKNRIMERLKDQRGN